MTRVGILGCGAIGQALAKALCTQKYQHVQLSFLCDQNPSRAIELKTRLKCADIKILALHELITKSDFVVEAASINAAQKIVPLALKLNKKILVLSVGALLEIGNLRTLLATSKGTIYVPSGALSGIDGILAARVGKITSVEITSRKPLRNLKSSPFFQKEGKRFGIIRKPTLIFDGNVREAVRYFPESLNVAATLSLAGIGPKRTRVRVITSPLYRMNQHEVRVASSSGEIYCQMLNLPSKTNPKTSQLAVQSAIATLSKIFSKIKIGT